MAARVGSLAGLPEVSAMEPLIVDHQEVEAAEPRPGAAPPPASPAAPSPGATVPPRVRSTHTAVIPAGYRMVETVWLCLGFVLAVLTLDFIFRAAGAHDTGFASFVYSVGSALAHPFSGIFTQTVTGDGHVYQWADLLAVAVYGLAGVGAVVAVRILTSRRMTSIETTS
ncbi:MAG TPA: hypothetical protein VG266_04130 [Candidatus Dormibacteraeota bacterium]|nr:hypothetical protein [Candidatus Dormibacteraeota bacterium]